MNDLLCRGEDQIEFNVSREEYIGVLHGKKEVQLNVSTSNREMDLCIYVYSILHICPDMHLNTRESVESKTTPITFSTASILNHSDITGCLLQSEQLPQTLPNRSQGSQSGSAANKFCPICLNMVDHIFTHPDRCAIPFLSFSLLSSFLTTLSSSCFFSSSL